jgi:hypothetical protein
VAVASGAARNGAAIIRPPGHHAESGTSLGFCLFNNAAVAARAAQKVQTPAVYRMLFPCSIMMSVAPLLSHCLAGTV